MAGKTVRPKLDDSQREKLDKRLSDLESQVLSLEEQAEYAEDEAKLRKRMADAKARIAANRPTSSFDFSGLAGKLPKGKGVKVMLVLVGIVVAILVIAKSCG